MHAFPLVFPCIYYVNQCKSTHFDQNHSVQLSKCHNFFKFQYFSKNLKNPLSASGQRPLLGSVSSRCPSGRRFAPYPGSKRRVAGQVPLFERNGTQGNRSAVRYVRIASRTRLLLPKFVDALLGIVSSSQVPVSFVRVRSGYIGPCTLYRPWEEGSGGWAGLWLSTKTL